MNRENRRALKKKLLNRRSRTLAANVLDNLDNEINNMIRDGDLVTLNVKRIMNRKEYPRMQLEYRQFVEANRDTMFTAHLRREQTDGFSALIELEGVEPWIFWYGDLNRVTGNQAKEGK